MNRRQRYQKSPSPPRRDPNRTFRLRIPNPEKTLARRKKIEEYQRKEALLVQLIEEMLRPELPLKKLSKEEEEFYNLLSDIFFENAKEGFELSVYNHEKTGSKEIFRSFTDELDEDLEDDVSKSVIISQNPLHLPNPLYSRYLEEMLDFKEMGKKFLREFNLVYLFENVYLSRGPIRKVDSEDCGCVRRCDENCINKLTKTECVGCHLGENCGNDNFQRRRWKSTSIEKAGLKGHGLFPNEDIKKGSFVIEYVGEILDAEQLRDRKEKYQRHCYFFSLGNDLAIDASLKGNQARFINHSCDPNLEPQKWDVDGEFRIGFFAKKDISKGTEFSFDYSFETFTEYKQKCLCGSANCRGYITSKKQRNQMKNLDDIKVLEAVSPTEQLKEVDLMSSSEDDDDKETDLLFSPSSSSSLGGRGRTISLNITEKMRTATPKGKKRRGRRRRKKKKPQYDIHEIMKNQEEICQNLVDRIDEISNRYGENLKKRRKVEEQSKERTKKKMMTLKEEEEVEEVVEIEDEDEEEEEIDLNEGIEIFDPNRMNRRFILKRNLKRGLMKRILQIHKKRQMASKLAETSAWEKNMDGNLSPMSPLRRRQKHQDIVPPPPPPHIMITPTKKIRKEVLAEESSDSDEDEIEALRRKKGNLSPREIRQFQRDRLKTELEEEEKEKEMKKKKRKMKKKKKRKMKKEQEKKKKKKKKMKKKNRTIGKKRKREQQQPPQPQPQQEITLLDLMEKGDNDNNVSQSTTTTTEQNVEEGGGVVVDEDEDRRIKKKRKI